MKKIWQKIRAAWGQIRKWAAKGKIQRTRAQNRRWVPRWRMLIVWGLAGIGLLAVLVFLTEICSAAQPVCLDDNSEYLRNIAVTLAAFGGLFIGLPLALWRNFIANEQAEVAARGYRDGRLEKGMDMLGSPEFNTRMAGILALKRAAETLPQDYYVMVTTALCAFIRFPKKDKDLDVSLAAEREDGEDRCYEPATVRPDVLAAAQVVGELRQELNSRGKLKDIKFKYAPGLEDANLCRAELGCFRDFSSARLRRATLNRANLVQINLEYADLTEATLLCAYLADADLTRANLTDADLSRAVLRSVRGLTQKQLNHAFTREGWPPPDLTGAMDPDTGEPLQWDPANGMGQIRPIGE